MAEGATGPISNIAILGAKSIPNVSVSDTFILHLSITKSPPTLILGLDNDRIQPVGNSIALGIRSDRRFQVRCDGPWGPFPLDILSDCAEHELAVSRDPAVQFCELEFVAVTKEAIGGMDPVIEMKLSSAEVTKNSGKICAKIEICRY